MHRALLTPFQPKKAFKPMTHEMGTNEVTEGMHRAPTHVLRPACCALLYQNRERELNP